MIVSLNWLKDFVDLSGLTTSEIANKFISIGYEVEELKDLGKGLDNVKVGKIIDLRRHPNAERLQICTIDLGTKKVQILTAATNVFLGALVPASLDGAHLPNGAVIKPTVMRGEVSEGMLCGGEELGINSSVYPTADVDGIMILDESAIPGQDIADFLGLNDVIFDLKVLPNRPDCQSVMGLAKELAAGLKREFIEPKYAEFSTKKPSLVLKVMDETVNCPLYLGCVIKNVNVQPSPEIIQKRLRSIGLNPKNNWVDLTNYVLWELGQPLHAFDYDKLAGNIMIRQARKGETLLGFDDKKYKLNESNMVISNGVNAVGIAGVMGGKDFSITDKTKNVVIESAIFNRVSIRKTSRALGLRTDASARFERGVEKILAFNGMKRILSLIEEFKLGEIEPVIQAGEYDDEERILEFDVSRVSCVLGVTVPDNDILDILNRLDIVSTIKDGVLTCKVPKIRADIERDVDIIEEIARFYGFDKIKLHYCENSTSIGGGVSSEQQKINLVVDALISSGANQIRTYSFRSPSEISKLLIEDESPLNNFVTISNPLSLDYSVMRTQMMGSLLDVVKANLNRQNRDLSLFEVGKVFFNDKKDNNMPVEETHVAYVTTKKSTFYDCKSILEMLAERLGITLIYRQECLPFMHPNICACVYWANKQIGYIGKIHPIAAKNFGVDAECYYFDLKLDNIPAKKVKKVKELPKVPASLRDLAVVVDEFAPVGDMVEAIKKVGGDILESVEVFDVYTGSQIDKGKKNVAFNLVFRKHDATLTQVEVNQVIESIVSQLKTKFNAELRK